MQLPSVLLPSVLWHCWLGSRKVIRPVKTEWWGDGVVVCLEQGADLHMAQLMPLPLTVSCFTKIQTGFMFLVPAHLGSPRKRAIKWVRVCVCCQCKTSKVPRQLPRWISNQFFLSQRSALSERRCNERGSGTFRKQSFFCRGSDSDPAGGAYNDREDMQFHGQQRKQMSWFLTELE